jgi:hypothetical protein
MLHPSYQVRAAPALLESMNRQKNGIIREIVTVNSPTNFIIGKNETNPNSIKNLALIMPVNAGRTSVAKFSYKTSMKRGGRSVPPRYLTLYGKNGEDKKEYLKTYLKSLRLDELQTIARIALGHLVVDQNTINRLDEASVNTGNKLKTYRHKGSRRIAQARYFISKLKNKVASGKIKKHAGKFVKKVRARITSRRVNNLGTMLSRMSLAVPKRKPKPSQISTRLRMARSLRSAKLNRSRTFPMNTA